MTTTNRRTLHQDTETGVIPERQAPQAARREALAGRYGAIGISAVAAAMRYAGADKNPAYAPSPRGLRIDLRFVEGVA